MIYKINSAEDKTQLDVIRIKTLVYLASTSLQEFRLDKGCTIPMHSHPDEQMGHLVSGKMNFILTDKIITIEPGDSWIIPGGEEHGIDVIDDCVVIEIFSPVRKD